MQSYYATLTKPFFAPPASIFGIVWPILYTIIAITFGYVFFLTFKKELPVLVALPFILNLIFNFAFTPLQFSLQNLLLATIDILLVLGTLIWAMIAIYQYNPLITYAQIPYLLWVVFATVLQISITYLNW
ncbi:MAG: tryptophan-rich sensory protein [Candidatus Woesearchaeota archaeon]|nr:tryptophan-rich sensory protein [Candidatus Woesearchaeota archaeon]